MKTRSVKLNIRSGFSLVEVLMVIVVIAILLSLLVPALNSVQKIAAEVRQKAQFSTIEVGLEAFNNDFGDYPDSDRLSGEVRTSAISTTRKVYCGAQKLAEAMVGLDGFGFHEDSIFGYGGLDGAFFPAVPLYGTVDLSQRKGPYLEMEVANAVSLNNLYSGNTGLLEHKSLVLCDRYGLLKNAATGKKTGKPILYFRANTNKTLLDEVYDFDNNSEMIALDGGVGPDPFNFFYKSITNPNFTLPPRPYRAESFILFSAGADGLYGTADDVYNFDIEP
jgi:prepilin-type N-terminal cleavage/methylation domain-containing protein